MSIILDGTNGIETPAINAGNIVGEVAFFGMTTPPAGWLKANGAEVSRTTYSALFDAIGTTFGAGDGSTTFALPDMRGEFPRGWDDGRGVDSGRSFGLNQTDGLRSHNHDWRYAIGGVGTFSTSASGAVIGFPSNNPVGRSSGFTIGIVPAANNNSGVVSTSAPTPNETRPRNIALLACIKF